MKSLLCFTGATARLANHQLPRTEVSHPGHAAIKIERSARAAAIGSCTGELPGVLAPSVGAAAAVSAVCAAAASRRASRARRVAAGRQRQGARLGRVARAAEAVATETSEQSGQMTSPFDKDDVAGGEKPALPLTWDNVETVLDEVRPYLRSDGGDCKIVEIDGTVVRLELQGSCSSCSASSVTLKMGIERTLLQRIPELTEVVAVGADEEPLSEKGVEEVLDGIRPFLSVSGGAIEFQELIEDPHPRVILAMSGPPLKSMAVRVEVVNRMKKKFPQVQDVEINPVKSDKSESRPSRGPRPTRPSA